MLPFIDIPKEYLDVCSAFCCETLWVADYGSSILLVTVFDTLRYFLQLFDLVTEDY